MNVILTGSSDRYQRTYSEKKKTTQDWREPAERDSDRILYSSAFRRLAGVTQVVSADEGHVFHNRLTHSLQVAQVARRLAERLIRKDKSLTLRLGGIDPDVAQAAGLAHDLGHPPFGHVAEDELDRLVTDVHKVPDGFEGNAQSFRIVNALAHRAPAPHPPGLNLTPATLNAMLKYPWFRELDASNSKPAVELSTGGKALKTKKASKFGAYSLERDQFNAARALFPTAGSDLKTPEAEIMDWADDLTFAVHDAEDFYRAGLIPLDRLSLDDDAERTHFFDGITARPELLRMIGGSLTSDYTNAFYRVIIGFPLDEKYVGTTAQRSSLRNFMSALIGTYINAFELVEPKTTGARFLAIHPSVEKQVRMLKLLTWHYVILNPSLATQQHGQRRIIRTLMEILHEAAATGNESVFPLAFKDQVTNSRGDAALTTRIITDIVSGMTERQAVEMYHRLTGVELGSIFDTLL